VHDDLYMPSQQDSSSLRESRRITKLGHTGIQPAVQEVVTLQQAVPVYGRPAVFTTSMQDRVVYQCSAGSAQAIRLRNKRHEKSRHGGRGREAQTGRKEAAKVA